MSAISAIQTSTNASTISIAASARLLPSSPAATSSGSLPNAAGNTEDSVHLSDSAKQYLQSSQPSVGSSAAQPDVTQPATTQPAITQPGTTVEQLVRAAAAGDLGALALLQVV